MYTPKEITYGYTQEEITRMLKESKNNSNSELQEEVVIEGVKLIVNFEYYGDSSIPYGSHSKYKAGYFTRYDLISVLVSNTDILPLISVNIYNRIVDGLEKNRLE